MFDNRLPAHQLDSLMEGDTVLIEDWPNGWREPSYARAAVSRTTATQVIVTRTSRNGEATYEERYRKKDAQLVGSGGRCELVDPSHSRTSQGVTRYKRRQRQAAIDLLARKWERDRDDLDALRHLHAAIGEYLEDVDADA